MASETQKQGFIVLLLMSGLLAWACADINHRMSIYGIYFWIPALSLVMPVLLLSPRGSLLITLPIALAADVWSAAPPGWMFWLWIGLWLFFSLLRPRLRRENILPVTAAVWLANSIAFWAFSLLYSYQAFSQGSQWRLSLQLWLLNSILIITFTFPWIRLQKWTLRQWGWDVDAEIQA